MSSLHERVKKVVTSHQDFPKKGVLFYDIFPVFQKPALVEEMVDFITSIISGMNVDAIAALDARGFLLGPWLASKLNLPFFPIRKKGKLPGQVVAISSSKEYGSDVLEMQKDSIEGKGLKFLLFDDLLATGGTLKAAEDLIAMTGNSVFAAYCLFEIRSLDGRSKISAPVHSFLQYD